MKNKRVKITSLSLFFIFCLVQIFVWVEPVAATSCCICTISKVEDVVTCTDGVMENKCNNTFDPPEATNEDGMELPYHCNPVAGACASQGECKATTIAPASCCICNVTKSSGDLVSCTDGISQEQCKDLFSPASTYGDDSIISYNCALSIGACDTNSGCDPKGESLFKNEVQAIDTTGYTPILQVKFGNTTVLFDSITCRSGEDCSIPWLGQYIGVVFQYIVGLAAFLAAVMIMIGGFLWLTSAGNPSRVTQGKEYITGALTGLLLALFSYIVLYTINPNLVSFGPLTLKQITPISMDNVVQEAESVGCPTAKEKEDGFTALATGYCKPERSNYGSDHDFLCAVGLNCECPAGRNEKDDCNSSSMTWKSCKSFDASTTNYCDKTASGASPQVGQVAADSCFAFGSQICLGGKTYTVTDRGGKIKGKHFDIFSSSCDQAMQVTGKYETKVGACGE
ncbi:MAG: 3D domain-containing protein [Candidatus Buchananbacteria bacterium]